MSRNAAPRIDVGECDLGGVFIHSFEGTPVGSTMTRKRFEVRAGNHTVATKGTLAEAEAVANALCGIVVLAAPEEVVAEAPKAKTAK